MNKSEQSEVHELSKLLLILGCQRSGTTLLASMLGRHSEINMLFESTSKDVLSLIGKKYRGNKLCVWRQIRFDQKASLFGHLMNRLVNFHLLDSKKYHRIRIRPTSVFSINDYLERGAILITISRDKEAVVKSMVNRTPLSEKQAVKEWEKAEEILQEANRRGAINIQFNDLIKTPEKVMKFLCTKLNLEFEQKMLEGSKYNIIYPRNKIIREKI